MCSLDDPLLPQLLNQPSNPQSVVDTLDQFHGEYGQGDGGEGDDRFHYSPRAFSMAARALRTITSASG